MEATAYTTPARRPRQSSGSGRRRSSSSGSLLGTEGELTPSGAQILHAGLKRSGRALALQVLGVYRYIADPQLKRVLPPRAAHALERDAFDLLLSDGQMKMKAILSPALHHLVWRGLVSELDVVEIDDYELVSVSEDETNESQQLRKVCVIHELTPRAAATPSSSSPSATPISQAAVTPRAKIVYSVGTALLASPAPSSGAAIPDLEFISETHVRDHGALPVAGGRLYYLSLFSDDYPATWEPVQTEVLPSISHTTPWAEWNRRRRYCTDIFGAGDRVLHTLREVSAITNTRKRPASEINDEGSEPASPPAFPPMVGIVRLKSGLAHLGVPTAANDFPFMFHIVLSDRERSVEVAFFGSMAAKNFLIIQEGDVIQLQGYSVDRIVSHYNGGKPKKIYVYPHLSAGVVSHVPDKFWQMLEMTRVLPERPRAGMSPEDDGETGQLQRSSAPSSQPTVWLTPTFISTLEAHQWKLTVHEELDDTYFDFVGVVSFVGRMHRHRLRSEDVGADGSVSAYRWIKVIDSSSPNEMVVRVYVNSQPTAFHTIQAGDVVLLSKLQWIDARKNGAGLEFATTSVFSTIRLNDDVEPFLVFVECLESWSFAKELLASGGAKTQYSIADSPLIATTESWLEGPQAQGYEPFNDLVPMSESVMEALLLLDGTSGKNKDDSSNHWIPEFNPRLSVPSTEFTQGIGYKYPFDDIAGICEAMEALSHRYLRVHVALHEVRIAPATRNNDVPEIEFLVTDGELQSVSPQPIRLRSSVLFKEPELPSPLDETVAPEAESLVGLLTPSAMKLLNTTSILRSTELPQFSPAKATTIQDLQPAEQEITLDIVKEYIMKNRQAMDGVRVGGLDVALHLYRMPHGEIDLWIDGMSL